MRGFSGMTALSEPTVQSAEEHVLGSTAAPAAPQIVYEHSHRLGEYKVFVLGAERGDGTWAGWIEFVPVDDTQRLRTGQETSQSNRDALVYWATGLEDVYLEGALARAKA
jgi:hypothetical protein